MKAHFKFIRSRFSLELQVHTVSLTREAVGEAAGKGRREEENLFYVSDAGTVLG